MLKHELPKKISVILFFALLSRALVLFTVADIKNMNYQEYGQICKNIHSGKGYSYFYYENNEIATASTPTSKPLPSAFMPLGYIAFLLPFFEIENEPMRTQVILFVQVLLSLIIIACLYYFTKKHFSERSAVWAAWIYAIIPEFIIAPNLIALVTLYHLFTILLFISLYRFRKNENFTSFLYLGLVSIVLVYLRSEFILLFLIILLLMFRTHNKRYVFFTFIFVLLSIIPWQVRNYTVFNKPFIMSTNGGLNLYRGNNPFEIGFQGDKTLTDQFKNYQNDRLYEVKVDSIFFSEAIHTIKDKPGQTILNAFKKLSHLWLIYTDDNRAKSIFYFLPWFAILGFAALGLIKTFNFENHKYVYLFFLFSSLMAMVFFALPRHQTMMKIMLIPFSGVGIEVALTFIRNYINKNNETTAEKLQTNN